MAGLSGVLEYIENNTILSTIIGVIIVALATVIIY